MCLQSVWLWNNCTKTTGMFGKANASSWPPSPRAGLLLRGGKEWGVVSYCQQKWSTLTQLCFVMSKLHFLPPTSSLPNTQDLMSSYLRGAFKSLPMPTFYDRARIIIAHLWGHKRINRPETACDLTTSHTPHLKNAGKRDPKRPWLPQTLSGQQRWRSSILTTAKVHASSILIRDRQHRYPGTNGERTLNVSFGLQGADEYQCGSLRAEDSIDTVCTMQLAHTAKITAGHCRHT